MLFTRKAIRSVFYNFKPVQNTRTFASKNRRPIRFSSSEVVPPTPQVSKSGGLPNLQLHGTEIVDNFRWLENLEDPEVNKYIEKENKFTTSFMSRLSEVQGKLYKEMENRMQKQEESVPEQIGDYEYFYKYPVGKQFPIFCRRKVNSNSSEQVILDQNQESKGHPYFGLGMIKLSYDSKKVLYTCDITGDESYFIRIKDLETGKYMEEEQIQGVVSVEWCSNNDGFFYTVPDKLKRPHKVYFHRLGHPIESDVMLYSDDDPSVFVDVRLTKDKKFITINSNTKTTSEVWILKTELTQAGNTSSSNPILIQKRKPGVQYFVEHASETFFVVTNADDAFNYKIVTVPDSIVLAAAQTTSAKPILSEAKIFLDHNRKSKIDDVDIFNNHVVIYESSEGSHRIRVINISSQETHFVDLPESIINIQPGANLDFWNAKFRFSYSSPLTPNSVYDYDMDTKNLKLMKKETLDFDSKKYICKRMFAHSDEDEADVPMTLIYNRDIKLNQSNPTLMIVYGAYGRNLEVDYQNQNLSLLERNWVIAFAHIRGGSESGHEWYEQGKKQLKRNSISDFLSCARKMIRDGYTNPNLLCAITHSAGAVVLGSAINISPDLFRCIVMRVPFLDVITSMSNPDLPLTAHEYEEWGNINDKSAFDYVSSYDPYLNVRDDVAYPNMLITGSTNDIRVPFWQPLKYVAKMRHNKMKEKFTCLLKMDSAGGHFGLGGRFGPLVESAYDYSFLIHFVSSLPATPPKNITVANPQLPLDA